MDQTMFNKLIASGVKHGASDVHFLVGQPPKYRVKGTLVPLKVDKLTPQDTLEIAQIVFQKNPTVIMKDLTEVDTSYSLPKIARFRVCIFKQRGTVGIVMRIIPSATPSIEDLNLPSIVKKIAHMERGLVLVTGVTGSGKSSTLAAMIKEINTNLNGKHIITIEDPIEFLHPHIKCSITQREVGPDTRSFNAALRTALRQDPDIIMVGEMRDYETIDTALKAAETGHLVFSTVHTTDAAKTINRLMAVFPAEEQQVVRYRLVDSLKATISQRLLPRADGQGRLVAAEVLISTQRIQEYIADVEKTGSLLDVLNEGYTLYGTQSFDLHLSKLYQAGKITLEVAQAAATSPADFERALSFE
ncbi:type IV pilus twitching motility protein PilT [candidate division CSSED10-310 bacterium]|uniref:Type IV pilus twitching motility protein PilT n=1 Tax=candidate division CSSED10-310 bacterium TaxID=2855610 RepID=A0ABV6Z4A6_UNCC1